MADAPTEPAARPRATQRLYVRFYLALLGSLVLAAFLFALIHLGYYLPPRHGDHRAIMGLFALLFAVALGVSAGAYPIVRRLTRRLERLQDSVEAWGEGKLSTRVAVEGRDEVALLAESFNRSAARIEALVAAQKTLLANASHELRSPLARIRVAVELLQQDAPPEACVELARNIGELDQLVGELLLASRLDSGIRTEIEVVDLDLTALVAEECARANAELSASVIRMTGEPKLLRRMVRNLLDNAVRHGKGTPIAVHLAADAGSIRLDVCDGGAGVPESERESIFTPFYRLPGASEADGGVGLGLSLVRQIARRHGGDVACLPRGEGGCCFRVTLPLGRDR